MYKRQLHNGRQAFLERRLLLAGILPAANIAAQKIDGLRVLHNGKQVLFDGTVAFIAGNLALLSAA